MHLQGTKVVGLSEWRHNRSSKVLVVSWGHIRALSKKSNLKRRPPAPAWHRLWCRNLLCLAGASLLFLLFLLGISSFVSCSFCSLLLLPHNIFLPFFKHIFPEKPTHGWGAQPCPVVGLLEPAVSGRDRPGFPRTIPLRAPCPHLAPCV